MLCAVLLYALAASSDTAAPIPFATLTVEDARRLNGQDVTVAFTIGAPAYTHGEGAKLVTVIGPGDVDEHERTAVLRGDRLKQSDVGRKVRVSGRLRVIDHAPALVNGQTVGAWVEIRVEK